MGAPDPLATVGRPPGTAAETPPANIDAGAAIVVLNVVEVALASESDPAVRETIFGEPGKFPIATVAVLLPLPAGSEAAASGAGSTLATARAVVAGCLPAASA